VTRGEERYARARAGKSLKRARIDGFGRVFRSEFGVRVSLLNKLSDSLLSTTGRTRDRAFLDAAMAASALVATADGEVSFAQRSRLDDLLASVEPLKAHDVHDAADLFRIFADNILAHPEKGRARALKAVQCVTGDSDAVRLLMRIACAIARADGSYSRPGMVQIRRIAKTLGQCELELDDEEAAEALAGAERPYFITVGNHKGGTGKSTTAMHLAKLEESDWPTAFMLSGVWTIFPHVSIASFGEEGDSRGVLISQLFPGDAPGESYTIQNYLLEKAPDEAQSAVAREQFGLLKYVVEEEDYATGMKQQKSLRTGARDHIIFGRNEAGGQNFHQWVKRVLATDDKNLNDLFANPQKF